ncbi:MAG TPA: tRNA (adenosine(37)-N6)-threonylcarbamoyltransferase complex ATPase subunit type 1 TsaE [Thermoanaerobaculia bacterium]|jgi:tRNA threonylcarbamoyladenosine biosynthesis protein TsaE|nr:tRNA (adenosine(37)-N6)-threonylcarbamoyltransferase complex ATPase subunit type 1 TsaE [Thermoanaerobaculia bacterium]
MRRWRTGSPAETRRVGEQLLPELLPDGTLLLLGDLAAGKTVLAQGVAAGLGIDPGEVQSPTYTLVREHQGPRGRLLHLDLYRLEPAEASLLGLEEILAAPAVKVVEWAERLPLRVPAALVLQLTGGAGEEREIRELIDWPAEATA